MPALLMPKATAVWLVDNTTLSFDQIAKLCQLHSLEIQAIADGEVSSGIMGLDPIANGQLTHEEIKRCEADPSAELTLVEPDIPISEAKPKGARYTPISKRNDKPDAIAWLVKNMEDLSDAQIGRLVGTTKPTINAVRDRSHWNSSNLRPRHPVELGLCSRVEIEAEIAKAQARKAKQAKKKPQPRPATTVTPTVTPTVAAPDGDSHETPVETPTVAAPDGDSHETPVGVPDAPPHETPVETPVEAPVDNSPRDESSRDDSTEPTGTP